MAKTPVFNKYKDLFEGLTVNDGKVDLSPTLRHPYLPKRGPLLVQDIAKEQLYKDVEELGMRRRDVPGVLTSPMESWSGSALTGMGLGTLLGGYIGRDYYGSDNDMFIGAGIGALGGGTLGVVANLLRHNYARKRFLRKVADRMREMSGE